MGHIAFLQQTALSQQLLLCFHLSYAFCLSISSSCPQGYLGKHITQALTRRMVVQSVREVALQDCLQHQPSEINQSFIQPSWLHSPYVYGKRILSSQVESVNEGAAGCGISSQFKHMLQHGKRFGTISIPGTESHSSVLL